MEESQADKDITLLVSHLINDKQTDNKLHTAIEKQEEIDEVTKEWRNYCKVFADKGISTNIFTIHLQVSFIHLSFLYYSCEDQKKQHQGRYTIQNGAVIL